VQHIIKLKFKTFKTLGPKIKIHNMFRSIWPSSGVKICLLGKLLLLLLLLLHVFKKGHAAKRSAQETRRTNYNTRVHPRTIIYSQDTLFRRNQEARDTGRKLKMWLWSQTRFQPNLWKAGEQDKFIFTELVLCCDSVVMVVILRSGDCVLWKRRELKGNLLPPF
jgi:hypothetical protein